MKRRVVVTGVGLVTPLGNTTQSTWEAACAGTSGIAPLHEPEFADYPVRIAGRVTHDQAALEQLLSAKEQRKTDRFTQLGLLAATQAVAQAGGLEQLANRTRAGVYLGVGIGGLATIVAAARDAQERGLSRVSPLLIPKAVSNEAASAISIAWDLQGPTLSVSSACSSGADALGLAYQNIMSGNVDLMVAGGVESVVTPLAMAGFGNMRALARWQGDPTQASRPFDSDRTGFVIAEGAGVLVLEEEQSAQARGADIMAYLSAYGSTADAYHTTAIHPEGRGARAAIAAALAQAECKPEQVSYINAHGTGTKMNDLIESEVIADLFGNSAPLVSSTKSMTGHMLGAAGGVEAGFCVLALRDQLAPPTINLDNPDPACALNHVHHTAQSFDGQYALSNSFGFGGSNAVLLFKKSTS